MKSKDLISWVGIVMILVTGLIHLYNAPGEFQDAPYMGILFFVFFLGSIVSAVGIYKGSLLWGWALGAFLAIGAIVGYLLSRTVGMPVSGVEDWGPLNAYIAMALELIFAALFLRLQPLNSLKRRSN
jgi:hypothetical protein